MNKTTIKATLAALVIMVIISLTPNIHAQGLFNEQEEKKENKKGSSSKGSSSASDSGSDSYGYSTGIGIRAGFTSGLSIKHFIKSNSAIEGIIGSRWRGFSITGLYEIHKAPALGVSNLAWEYGGGARVGFYNSGYYYRNDDRYGRYYDDRNVMTIGIVGILGLEYQFGEIPFSLGLDIMPYFDFIGRGNGFVDGSLSLRYVIQ